MSAHDTYEAILQELASGEMTVLQKQIFELLKSSPQGCTRQELVYAIFGYVPQNLNGNVDDRKIRKAIEGLRSRLFPIVSNSGQAGYRLDVSREGVRKMLADLRSRRDKIQEQINAAAKFYSIPDAYEPPMQATQLELGG